MRSWSKQTGRNDSKLEIGNEEKWNVLIRKCFNFPFLMKNKDWMWNSWNRKFSRKVSYWKWRRKVLSTKIFSSRTAPSKNNNLSSICLWIFKAFLPRFNLFHNISIKNETRPRWCFLSCSGNFSQKNEQKFWRRKLQVLKAMACLEQISLRSWKDIAS